MNEFGFAKISHILPLIHIIAVIFFINSQICCINIVRIYRKSDDICGNCDKIKTQFYKYERSFLIYFAVIIISGYFISMGSDYKFADPMVTGIITTLWIAVLFILVNFVYVHYKILSFKKAVFNQNEIEANEHLIIILKYFIPLNIVISLICVYLGVTISEF